MTFSSGLNTHLPIIFIVSGSPALFGSYTKNEYQQTVTTIDTTINGKCQREKPLWHERLYADVRCLMLFVQSEDVVCQCNNASCLSVFADDLYDHCVWLSVKETLRNNHFYCV